MIADIHTSIEGLPYLPILQSQRNMGMKKIQFGALSVLVLLSTVFFFNGFKWFARPIVLQPPKSGISTLRLYDNNRGRPLITEVWYPVDEQIPAQPVGGLWVRCPEARDAPLKSSTSKYPLVVMSHGNGGDRMNTAWLAEILAANGYIIAAVDHHGNTWNNKIAECFVKIWERPQDISFVIDRLVQDSRFSPYIDSAKIGFIGYSLGGQTGLWIAGGRVRPFEKPSLKEIQDEQTLDLVSQETIDSIDFSPMRKSYQDSRVSAMFLMAPAFANIFDIHSLQSIQVPVYIVASEGDKVVPLEKSATLLTSQMKRVACTLIPGVASHYVFLNEASRGGHLMLDRSIALDPPTVDRKKIHEEIGLAAVEFFDNYLK